MTRDVKRTYDVENRSRVHYNLPVSTARILGHFAVVVVALAGCEKKSTKTDTGALNALDHAAGGSGSAGPVDTTPLQGVDVSKLDGDKQQLFYQLVGSLNSPCGQGHSLRVSYATDTACKRAPFAVKYVLALLDDEYPEPAIRKYYHQKYESKQTVKLDLEKAPRVGPSDAPIRIVEFYDYGCSHCAEFRPKLKEVEAAHDGQVAAYFKMFPLGNWADSKSAAQAALAANAQGRFAEMHDLLFANAHNNGEVQVKGFAAQLGLDLARFAQDYKAFEAQVDADRAQGEALGINLTPTVYFNDRPYEGPLEPKYLGMWIEEEIAVNR